MGLNSSFLWSSASVWAVIPMIGTFIVHIAFSAAVYTDASRFQKDNGKLVFVGPVIWSLAALFGGLFAAIAYWVVHHSTLSRN